MVCGTHCWEKVPLVMTQLCLPCSLGRFLQIHGTLGPLSHSSWKSVTGAVASTSMHSRSGCQAVCRISACIQGMVLGPVRPCMMHPQAPWLQLRHLHPVLCLSDSTALLTQ
jgi:hypothetical protein